LEIVLLPRTTPGTVDRAAPLIINPLRKFRLEVEVLVFFIAMVFDGSIIIYII